MDTFAAANLILKHFIDTKDPVRNMKLQKLLYFSCGWYSAYFNNQWLIEDDFYAWPYGPVCPKLYYKVVIWENNPITEEIQVNNNNHKDEEKKIIESVIGSYGHLTDWQLSNITHKEATPWTNTINKKFIGSKIERDVIEKHYRELLEKKK